MFRRRRLASSLRPPRQLLGKPFGGQWRQGAGVLDPSIRAPKERQQGGCGAVSAGGWEDGLETQCPKLNSVIDGCAKAGDMSCAVQFSRRTEEAGGVNTFI